MKIYDITSENTRIIDVEEKLIQSEFIHRCSDCLLFETCEINGKVNHNSIACEKFIE
jgi:hypothetical protein